MKENERDDEIDQGKNWNESRDRVIDADADGIHVSVWG